MGRRNLPLNIKTMQILSIEDLYRLRDCEVKELLKNNDKFKVGGYIYVKSGIGKIIALDSLRICYKRHCVKFFETIYKNESTLLTYEFYKELEARRIENKFKNISQEILNKFILKKAIEFYGEDNVDYLEDFNRFVIKLGNVEVKNELGMAYTITDMWMSFKTYDKRLNELRFYRSSFKPEEARANGDIFIHSHVSPSTYLQSENVCFGGTDIAAFVSKLKAFFSIKEIDQFFLCINTFLSNESLQGVPYMKISSIYENQFEKYNSYYHDYFKEIATYLFSNMDKFTYTFNDADAPYLNKFPIINNHEIVKIIYDYVMSSNNDDMIKNVIVNSDGTEPVRVIQRDGSGSYPDKLPITFKGNDISIIQLPSEVNINNFNITYPKTVHPFLVKEISEFINEHFNDFLLKKYNE